MATLYVMELQLRQNNLSVDSSEITKLPLMTQKELLRRENHEASVAQVEKEKKSMILQPLRGSDQP